MPECQQCGCDIPARRDCPYCGSGYGDDELGRLHTLQRGMRAGSVILIVLLCLAIFAYVVPYWTYDVVKTMEDPRLAAARRHLREGDPAAAEAILKPLKKEIWVSGLPDAFLAASCHLRYLNEHDSRYLEEMREHLEDSADNETSLPQNYFAAVYAAETGKDKEALNRFASCHKTLTMPSHVWDTFLDRGTVNGNIALWIRSLESNGAPRPKVLYGL